MKLIDKIKQQAAFFLNEDEVDTLKENVERASKAVRNRVPINIRPEVRERLAALLNDPAFEGTAIGYSDFIEAGITSLEENLDVIRDLTKDFPPEDRRRYMLTAIQARVKV